jgi:hypothetical protein
MRRDVFCAGWHRQSTIKTVQTQPMLANKTCQSGDYSNAHNRLLSPEGIQYLNQLSNTEIVL